MKSNKKTRSKSADPFGVTRRVVWFFSPCSPSCCPPPGHRKIPVRAGWTDSELPRGWGTELCSLFSGVTVTSRTAEGSPNDKMGTQSLPKAPKIGPKTSPRASQSRCFGKSETLRKPHYTCADCMWSPDWEHSA